MSADIVEKLRCERTGNPVNTDTRPVGQPCDCDACNAAAEIERLKSALATCREIREYDAKEIGRLRAVNERLKARVAKLEDELVLSWKKRWTE